MSARNTKKTRNKLILQALGAEEEGLPVGDPVLGRLAPKKPALLSVASGLFIFHPYKQA